MNPDSSAPDALPRHPAAAYEMLYNLLILALVMRLRSRLADRPGVLFNLYALLYAFGRFWVSALRVNRPFLLDLNEAQVVSILVLLVCVPLSLRLWRRPGRAASTATAARLYTM